MVLGDRQWLYGVEIGLHVAIDVDVVCGMDMAKMQPPVNTQALDCLILIHMIDEAIARAHDIIFSGFSVLFFPIGSADGKWGKCNASIT